MTTPNTVSTYSRSRPPSTLHSLIHDFKESLDHFKQSAAPAELYKTLAEYLDRLPRTVDRSLDSGVLAGFRLRVEMATECVERYRLSETERFDGASLALQALKDALNTGTASAHTVSDLARLALMELDLAIGSAR